MTVDGAEIKRRRPGRPSSDQAAEGETRARIIWAAAELFSQRGYADVSTGDIAAAVGVTKATLYYHFRGKDAIYTAVMCTVLQTIGRVIRETARGPGSVRERLYHLAEIPMLQIRPDAGFDVMMRDAARHVSPQQREEIAVAWQSYTAAYEELMRDGIDRGELKPLDPRLLAYAFRHLIEAFSTSAEFRDRPAVVDILVDLFLQGAADRPSSKSHAGIQPPAAPYPSANNRQ